MKVRVVTPMWPTPEAPHKGVFVQHICAGLEQHGFHIESVAKVRGQRDRRRDKVFGHGELAASIIGQALGATDLLYCHAPSWFSPLVQLAGIRARRLVVHAHGGEVYPFSKIEAAAQPWVGRLLRQADLVVSPSEFYAQAMQDMFGFSADTSFVSPSGGVNTRQFRPSDQQAARRKLGLSVDKPVLGFVGRLDRVKGPLTLAKAAGLMKTEAQVLVVGSGEVLDEMQRALPHARFLPWVAQEQLAGIYAAMDVLAFPTEREALGLVPLEALSCGVPVVAPKAFANPEFVRDGQSGLLVRPKDPQDLAQALDEILMAEDAQKQQLREGSRAIALEYDDQVVAAALADRLSGLFAA